MKKSFLTSVLAFAIYLSYLVLPVLAAEEHGFVPNLDISAKAVYLYNLDTGQVIYEKNAHVPMPPASMTKLMTCILALENTPDLTEKVPYPLAVQDQLYLYQKEHGRVSNAGLLAGEELSMEECIYALMLPSANEVALNIAVHLSGSEGAFVQKMNERARELGAKDTNFVNPNGLYDAAHLSTAYDIAQIAKHAISIPGFMDYANTTNYNPGPTNKHETLPWVTTNKLLLESHSYYYPAASGIKTGMVPEAGFSLVSTASKDGFTYLLVVMGCGVWDENGKLVLEKEKSFEDSIRIYEWAFNTFRVQTLIEKGYPIGEAGLRLSFDQDHVKLMSGDRFTALLPKDINKSNIQYQIYAGEAFDSPVKKGSHAGEVALMLEGIEIGRVPLVIAETVEASPALVLLEKAKMLTRSFPFKFTVVFLVLLLVLYIFLMMIRNKKRRRGGYRPRRRM